jgi:hypothetical protein
LTPHKIGIAQPPEMMRNSWLFQWKAVGEVAHANLISRPRKCCQDRQSMRIGERLEELGVIGELEVDDFRRRTATRY